jgi:hypothetical protein
MCTQTTTIRINTVYYALTVETFGPESSASWRCQCCEEHHGGTCWAQNDEEASTLAMSAIWDHHDDCHVAVTEPAMATA